MSENVWKEQAIQLMALLDQEKRKNAKLVEFMSFTSDDDALELLKTYGHEEAKNGIIRGDWRSFDDACMAAVKYLCDEWDFVFEHVDSDLSTPHTPTGE
ncbi:hypothetical protein FOB41_09755 [Agrobacterium pusense]|uniref:Uncharacterized protein n=1 Tax=Agrobacterium pusense TaxID=648995 RepID=A0A6H0ZND0_9HYPH|nr:hypothetical protein [Agrobacterium pusense]QIX21401.1 hypothetical protein FOB41_09755 [Agrobacterium pusense]